MKEQIKAVEQYFKDKILAKDFVIKSIDEHVLCIIIDEQYEFFIWIANYSTIPTGVKLYDGKINYMNIRLSNKESVKLCGLLKKDIESLKNTVIMDAIEQKRKELEALENSML